LVADRWENRTDEETMSHVLNNIRQMFPPPIYVPEPTNYVITRWKSDPFTRGTYHYHRVGVDTYAGQDILAEPVGNKLFFAGEATTDGMAAPNAYHSGERAIDQIFESLGRSQAVDAPLQLGPMRLLAIATLTIAVL
jgi:monoamine oxidase